MDLSESGRRWQTSNSDDDWQEMTRLAWRPAWGIRSRQGAISLLLAWFRKKSQPARSKNQEPQKQ